MNELALPPGRGPRTRLWDDDYNCLYDSATDDRTVEQFMRDHTELNYSIDHPPNYNWRTRRSGKIVKDTNGELHWKSARELLEYLRWPEIDEPFITCPVCHMTSYNPNDIREGFCGNCHGWTSPPLNKTE